MATRQELERFLAAVERRAYKHSLLALRDEDAALDAVQDAMLKLAEKYAHKPAEELPLLFQRILQNTLRDHFRRSKVRNTWTSLLSALFPAQADDSPEQDPLDTLESGRHENRPDQPQQALEQSQVMAAIEQALAELSPRQREAFLLRYWEELDITETARVMGCSEGSVKTHCFRATETLAAVLRQKGITL